MYRLSPSNGDADDDYHDCDDDITGFSIVLYHNFNNLRSLRSNMLHDRAIICNSANDKKA